MARTWYTIENINSSYEVHDNTLIIKEATRNLREQAETQEPDSDYSKATIKNELVDLLNVGLRRSGRKLRLSTILKESDPIDTRSNEITKLRESYGLLIVTLS